MTDRERMMKVMETENLSAKQFALEVGIQPGTISNIAGGRNNPSLDVMQKIYKRFPHYSAAWLFSDKGPMYYHDADEPNLFTVIDTVASLPTETYSATEGKKEISRQGVTQQTIKEATTFETGTSNTERNVSSIVDSIEIDSDSKKREQIPVRESARKIQRIMVFYTDGTYEER